MRVLMTTTGHAGHVLPLLPFANALMRAGHDVCVAGQRSRAEFIRRAGLACWPFDDPPEHELAPVTAALPGLSVDEANARVIGEIFGRIGPRAALPEMQEIIETWRPHVIVRETYEFASYLAAERHGIPHVRVGLGLASAEEEVLSIAAPAVDELRVELGLPADPDGERIHSAPYLTSIPSAFELPTVPGPPHARRFRDPGSRAAARLPDWWSGSEEPLVYVTFGSVAASLNFFPGLYRAAIDALAVLPIRVLVTIGDAGDPARLDPLPPNVHVERWVAQADVAAHAAAVVCHGGYGSTLGALAHGRPLVVVALFAGDQWHNARRVAQLGAGIALRDDAARRVFDDPGATVIAALADAVRSVLDEPGYRAAARRIEGAIDALPPVDAAVDLLRAVSAHARTMPLQRR